MYLLDANCYIAMHSLMPLDIYVSFWQWMERLPKDVHCIESIREEILKKQDELAFWTKQQSKNNFLQDVVPEYKTVSDFVIKNYEMQHASEFLKYADARLVAMGLAHNATVVTFEKRIQEQPNSRAKIPNVCDHLEVKCIDFNNMLRKLQITF